MKKSLLALAVLASIAGVASAQSSVTIYGVVDAGIAHERSSLGNVTKVATGQQSGNRLGFKGTEDLGGGLKANFQLENGFNLDTGTSRQSVSATQSRLFGRQAWVGLSGNFGAVALGRQYNPLFVSLDTIDPFGTGLAGSSDKLMNPSNVRTDNAVTYSSNTYGGFSATGLYGTTETQGNAEAGNTLGLAANYSKGPLVVTLAFDKVNGIAATTTPPASAKGGQELLLLGATYNFGPVTAHAGFEAEQGTGVDHKDFRSYMIGATVPVGAGSIVTSFIVKDDRTSGEAGAKQFAIGYLHSLSKRTNLYSSIAHINNDRDAAYVVGDASSGGTAVPASHNSTALSVGIRHKF